MEIIQICPECGNPGISVPGTAVRYNLNLTANVVIHSNIKWSMCSNPNCTCSYFSKDHKYKTADLIKPLWFKNNGDNAPICYCSDLTRGEIKDAVKKGFQTINSVQKYTNKNITGLCEEKNPLGKCCRNVFLKTISESH